MSQDNGPVIRTAVLATAGLGLVAVVFHNRSRIFQSIFSKYRDPLGHRRIEIVKTAEECQRVVAELKKHSATYRVIGFDCEWVTHGNKRRPTALLQLASHKGLCALFRLCCMQHIPKSLRELLEDENVLKVGVGPQDDAKKLSYDYGVGVASTFDLRYLATLTGHKAEGLAKLTKAILNVQLDKHWRISCSDWEASLLSERQILYAANDALVGIEIFKRLAKELEPRRFWQNNLSRVFLEEHLAPFVDVRYVASFTTNSSGENKTMSRKATKKQFKQWKRTMSTRPLYENCFLEAPDGEVLCTIDRRKAEWYLHQSLGIEVKKEPFTVRLMFEPAARAVGEVGQYYRTPKENQCVVCGARDVFIRKNIVPREYRKHFPVVMKTHTSHDVLILCPNCHQVSNISDMKIRTMLAEKCDAPIVNDESSTKYIEIAEFRQVKSAARALLQNSNPIPEDRCEELKDIVKKHYGNVSELTEELLIEAASIDTLIDNDKYCQHGEKVVQLYQTEFGGLLQLEKLWREHFLRIMKPRFLPPLWNVNHNADKLEIRAQEGRIDEKDLIAAGVELKTTTDA